MNQIYIVFLGLDQDTCGRFGLSTDSIGKLFWTGLDPLNLLASPVARCSFRTVLQGEDSFRSFENYCALAFDGIDHWNRWQRAGARHGH